MITLYGIHNCDKVRSANKWLTQHDITFQFHDWRQDGVPEKLINSWLEQYTWEALINRRSTSWRNLTDEQRKQCESDNLISIIKHYPTLLKRPILTTKNDCLIGFSSQNYQTYFAEKA